MSKQATKQWFIKVRGSYLPHAWQGWLLYIPYTTYIIAVSGFVLRREYTVWQSIFTLLPNYIAALVVMTWVAERTSKHV